MNIKDVSEKLINEISFCFEKEKFKFNKKENAFVKETNDYIQYFDLYFSKNSEGIIIEPQVRIQIKSIVSFYQAVTNLKNRPFFCLGNHLFEVIKYQETGKSIDDNEEEVPDWFVNNEESLNKLIEVIPDYFYENILPYFKENSSLNRVDELLSKFPRELSIHNYIYPLRANISIIAAKLNNNKRLSELILIYEDELKNAEFLYKEEFEKLKILM